MDVIKFDRFGGLNLIEDPQEAGAQQAISCLNVALDRNGRLRTRDGFDERYASGAAGGIGTELCPVSTGVVLASLSGDAVKAVNLTTGTATATVATTGPATFAAAGSGAIYFTDGPAHQIRKYSGGAFSSPASLATYEGNYLAVQPLEDRLVIADANSTSKLWFSDAATPETIDVANFLEVTPGDGQPITGMAVYDTSLIVFKRTKFFVFYGNSTDSTGGSIFNYRMVDMGIGCDQSIASLRLTATHETGVYFVGYDGVYRTTGGAPQKISHAIAPVFKGSNLPIPDPFSSVLSAPIATWYHLGASADRLYLCGVTAESTAIQFVMSLDTGEWTATDWVALSVMDGALIADSTDSDGYRGATIFGGANASGNGMIGKASRAYTDDDGTAIAWHHQSGFYDLSFPDREKWLWRSRLTGTGTVTLSRFSDFATSDTNAGSVALGATVSTVQHPKSWRGTLMSHKLSGTTAAEVRSVAHDIRTVRPVGLRSA